MPHNRELTAADAERVGREIYNAYRIDLLFFGPASQGGRYLPPWDRAPLVLRRRFTEFGEFAQRAVARIEAGEPEPALPAQLAAMDAKEAPAEPPLPHDPQLGGDQ